MIKRLIAFPLLLGTLVLCALPWLVMFPSVSKATVALGNPDPMVKACAANHTRLLPNYCTSNAAGGATAFVNDGACRTINMNAVFGVPTSATLAKVEFIHNLVSINALGTRQITVQIFQDAGCSTMQFSQATSVREQVAAAAVVLWSGYIGPNDAKLTSGATLNYISLFSSCTSCTHFVVYYGYYD